jgi:hypothetical protein
VFDKHAGDIGARPRAEQITETMSATADCAWAIMVPRI